MAKRRREAETPGQLLIEWDATATADSQSPVLCPQTPSPDVPPLVQHLKWDFQTTFPEPLPEAIDAGVLDESDLEPANLRGLHENYAHECLSALRALDIVTDARRRGVDPATGDTPRTEASAERLRRYFREEPARLQQRFNVLIETYATAFGDEAADAFAKAIRARHAGIDVVADTGAARQPTTAPAPIPEEAAPEVAEVPPKSPSTPKAADVAPRRFSCRLPVPSPLPEAVAAGNFGFEDDGKPIRPCPDEVRAITETLAEKLIDLLGAMQASAGPGQQLFANDYEVAVTAYAEDFGQDAAGQLQAHVHRRTSFRGTGTSASSRTR